MPSNALHNAMRRVLDDIVRTCACRGVLNIVHGARDVVNHILDHPDIKAISFVGSNQAGRYIYTRGCANGKRVQSNMGAKVVAQRSLGTTIHCRCSDKGETASCLAFSSSYEHTQLSLQLRMYVANRTA